MDIELQLPVWLVKELNKHSNKSTQYMIKKVLKEVINSSDGRRIIKRIGEEELGEGYLKKLKS